tara:strand:+ start:165 stop:1211 length:1047 start_codon:yes stop_codon:yes gene_type:complete
MDVKSHQEMNSESMDAPASQAPPERAVSELGPNPFEEAYEASGVLKEQPADSREASTEAGDAGETAPQATEGASKQAGVGETSSGDTEQSFLTDEEQATFDTNSPEYKAMQASFTKKMQVLAERERDFNQRERATSERLAEIEARLNGQAPSEATPQASPGVDWESMALSPPPEELADYEGFLTTRMKEVASHVIEQLQRQAEVSAAEQQRTNTLHSLKQQLTDMDADPAFSDYGRYYDQIREIAQQSPALLQRKDGLRVIYRIAKGDLGNAPAPEPQPSAGNNGNGNDYARGVKDGINQVSAKRVAAVPDTASTNVSTEPIRPKNRSLADAVAFEFDQARRHSLSRT